MYNSLNEYLSDVAESLDEVDWDKATEVATLLSIREIHAECEILQMEEPDVNLVRRTIPSPFDALTAQHIRTLYLIASQRFDECYRTQAQIVTIFAKEILQKRKDENWFLPICYRLCSDLRLCAKAADMKPWRPRAPEESSYLERSAGPILECYRSCVADLRAPYEVSKRLSVLNLTNQLFRVYFRTNKLNLLKPLIRAIENSGPLYDYFSMADKVTYKYYIGRKAMFDSDLKSAEDALTFAFLNCHWDSEHNRRLILMYLIPVKMFLGHMPSEKLLRNHDLIQFSEVAASVKEGNVLRLEKALQEHEPFFIKCGIFLMLEKLKIITYRTLFKKVCKILNLYQVPLEAFLVALQYMEVEDVDTDEVACIVANLIYQGKIKGYISHQHQKLVVSKQNPFPPLSTIAA